MLFEKDKLLSKQRDVATIFNKHFGSIRDYLNLFSWSKNASMSSGNNPISSICKGFVFHRKKKIKLKANRDHKKN